MRPQLPRPVRQFSQHHDHGFDNFAHSMNPDQLAELKNNEVVRKRLAKLMHHPVLFWQRPGHICRGRVMWLTLGDPEQW
jgi:hypothetical protein